MGCTASVLTKLALQLLFAAQLMLLAALLPKMRTYGVIAAKGLDDLLASVLQDAS